MSKSQHGMFIGFKSTLMRIHRVVHMEHYKVKNVYIKVFCRCKTWSVNYKEMERVADGTVGWGVMMTDKGAEYYGQ